MLLEAYFMHIDNTWNRLQTLNEYIEDTEARRWRAWDGEGGGQLGRVGAAFLTYALRPRKELTPQPLLTPYTPKPSKNHPPTPQKPPNPLNPQNNDNRTW